MKKSTFLTILLAISLCFITLSNSRAEQLSSEELNKYIEVRRKVLKENPEFDVQKKAISTAILEAVLKIDPSLTAVIGDGKNGELPPWMTNAGSPFRKAEDKTPEQKAILLRYYRACREVAKTDPSFQERTEANVSAIKAAMIKADPTIEPIIAKLARTPSAPAATPAAFAPTPAPAASTVPAASGN